MDDDMIMCVNENCIIKNLCDRYTYKGNNENLRFTNLESLCNEENKYKLNKI